jgi:hypothetical protein
MSYMDQMDASTGSDRFIMTPAMADIFAVQRYYGTPNTGDRFQFERGVH